MGKIIDLTNQQFGYLTVLYKTDKRAKDRSIIWHCKCKCGNECDIVGTSLRNGTTKSCGCFQRKRITETLLKPLKPGDKYGKLTILKMLDERTKEKDTIYECLCDCGNITKVRRHNLVSGNTKSCGCLQKEKSSEYNKIDLKGKTFNYLTVLSELKEKDSFGQTQWLCQCKCGNLKIVNSTKLINNHTTSCGCRKKSVGEEKISELLNKKNIPYKTEYRFENCKDKKELPFDFYINNQYLIEYDGEQHFKEKDYFGGEEALKIRQYHDELKNNFCKNNNIPLIRIPYTHLKDLCLDDLLLETTKFRVV